MVVIATASVFLYNKINSFMKEGESMTRSNIKATFLADIETVWNIVTSLEDYSWRQGLDRIEVLSEGKEFVEYTKDGYSTNFVITAFEPCKRYEFDMENNNMKGHWTGIFSCENGMTTIDFTEDVKVKKLIMKPFIKGYLKKQQALYIDDLKKALK